MEWKRILCDAVLYQSGMYDQSGFGAGKPDVKNIQNENPVESNVTLYKKYEPMNELMRHIKEIPKVETARLTLSALTERTFPPTTPWCWTRSGTVGGATTM